MKNSLNRMNSTPYTSSGFEPPRLINVLNDSGGFYAQTKTGKLGESYEWHPGFELKKSTVGILISFDPNSTYQNTGAKWDNVTKALYKVAGHKKPILVWFENKNGLRIA